MRTTIKTFKRKFTSLLQTNPGLAIFSSISLGVFLAGFLFFSFKYLLPDTQVAIAKENQAQQVNEVKTSVSVKAKKSIMEVHIANTGMTYIQGAEVVSISGPTIVVSTVWNNLVLKWTVHTNESYYENRHFGTSFLTRKGDRISIENIHVGDKITISGDLEKNANTPTIMANTIRTPY